MLLMNEWVDGWILHEMLLLLYLPELKEGAPIMKHRGPINVGDRIFLLESEIELETRPLRLETHAFSISVC